MTSRHYHLLPTATPTLPATSTLVNQSAHTSSSWPEDPSHGMHHSRKLSLFPTEAEYVTLTHTTKQASYGHKTGYLWAQTLAPLGLGYKSPMMIYCDSQSAITQKVPHMTTISLLSMPYPHISTTHWSPIFCVQHYKTTTANTNCCSFVACCLTAANFLVLSEMVVPENACQAMSASAGRALHIHISSRTWSWAHIPARAAMAMSSMVSPAWGNSSAV